MLLSLVEFVAHFHVLLVHLPIGILLIGLLLHAMAQREKFRNLQPAVPVVLFWGAVMALFSCITGYLLSITDDYDTGLLSWHMWMGISVAIVAWLLYGKVKRPHWEISRNLLSVVLLLLIMITGHLGGSITHGSDYLTKPLRNGSSDSLSKVMIPPVTNVQEAMAYHDIIKPILQTKCYSCHGPNKQKGKLRMDDSLFLMKGGKDGKVIEAGNGESSSMIKRLLLPVDNEDHMPPKEKPQPTEAQIDLLKWWISTGADFNKKVNQLDQPEKIKPTLLALQKAPEVKKENLEVPATPVEKADEKVIEQLRRDNIVVIPVSQNSNYLTVNFVTDSVIKREDLDGLKSIKKQLISLKIGNTNLSDSQMVTVGELKSLVRLNLENTLITDKGLALLKGLSNLQYLNLVGTKVSATGLLTLKGLPSLKSLFLYQALISKSDWPVLKNAFPKVTIDTGGYLVPLFPLDTVVVKEKKEY